jgi:hypothetical protein
MNYEIISIESGNVIKRINDDNTITFIPSDPANSDYQTYLASLNK